MSDELRAQWRAWLEAHPEWVKPLAEFLRLHPEMVADKSAAQMYWHDLINILVYPYMKLQLAALDKPPIKLGNGGNK